MEEIMKVAFLFAGQGSHYVGMGSDLYEAYPCCKKIYDDMYLAFDVKDICFHGPLETLNNTKYAQSCILTTSLAIAQVVKEMGIEPSYVAGLSLGEYSALSFSGVFTYQDAGQIVEKRGQIMADALPKGFSGMAAVLGMSKEEIQEVLQSISSSVCIANYNCPNQIVISGKMNDLQIVMEALKEKGCRRIIPLQVSGAFHSPLLNDASKQLMNVLKEYELRPSRIPVVYNVSGQVENRDIRQILSEQIKSSVLFEQSIHFMINQGVDTFIEIGPGKTLSGFVKKISKDVKVYSVNDCKSVEVLRKELVHA